MTTHIENVNSPDSFLFIIGAMKSGTTSLFDILSQHPQICPSRIKEPDYFIQDRDKNALGEYLALWNWDSAKHRFAIESSVAYTKSPFIKGVPKRIYDANLGNYKFIYMLRNPITRIESQVRHGLYAGWGKSLDECMTDDLLDFTRYATQINNYLEFFPRQNILLIILEEFQSDPDKVLTQICKFLHIDESFQFRNVGEKRNSGEFFNTSQGFQQIIQGSVSRFIIKKLLSEKLKSRIRSMLVKVMKTEKQETNMGRWKLNNQERQLIYEKLANDLRQLESEFGMNIRQFWNIPEDITSLNKGN